MMHFPKYGCIEEEQSAPKEEEVLVDDNLFREAYKGDSRKWLMRDGHIPDLILLSNMKASYKYPVKEEKSNIGIRKAMLLNKLFDEAAEEIIREQNEPSPIEEYCTEYDGNYSALAGPITELDEETNQELYEKYPLYSSPAMSYWNFQIEKRNGAKISLPGLTASMDLKNPFKRNSGFTKPISEVLDDCNL